MDKTKAIKLVSMINPFRFGTDLHHIFEVCSKGFSDWKNVRDNITKGKSQVDFVRDYSRTLFTTVIGKDGKRYMVPTIPDPEYLKANNLEGCKTEYPILTK